VNSIELWDVTPCILVNAHHHLGETASIFRAEEYVAEKSRGKATAQPLI
jgi:hypothetical protein